MTISASLKKAGLFTLLASVFALFPASTALYAADEPPAAAATSGTGTADAPAKIEDLKITKDLAERFSEETRLVISYMTSRHYADKGMAEIDSANLIDTYMEDLDYSKLFFVKADKDALESRFAGPLKSEYLAKGNLFPAFEIFNLYRHRALDRLAWVFKRLQGDFDFTADESYRPDRHDLEWPANQLEADQLWERRLKYEMLDGIINGETVEQARDRLVHRYQRTERALGEFEPYEVEEMFLNSFTTMFDPHSNFMSVESAENFSIMISNSLQGIGAMLTSEDGYCIITELVPGGPAELCGQLNPGDKIVAVAQGDDEPVDVVDMKLSKVVKLIRGDKGSEVRLTIVPANNPTERSVVSIVRDEIRLTDQLARAWLIQAPDPENPGKTIPVGVIDLPSFYGANPDDGPDAPSTTHDVQELLVKLQAQGAKAIVLDLRRNGGGLLSEAIGLTGLFIKDGPVVQVRFENGKVIPDFDDDSGLCTYDGPLVVLVSRNSASASEICAGALQVLHRAVIVGDRTTHGKGTVQQTVPLNNMRSFFNPFSTDMDLGMLKITIQKFYLPDGASTQERGVHSNIEIPSINELLPIGETDLDHYLPWDSIAPTVWNPADVTEKGGVLVTPELVSALKAKTDARMEKMPEFDYLRQAIAQFKKKDDQKDISINKDERLKEKEEDKAFRNRMEDWLDELKADDSYGRSEVDLELSKQKEAAHQKQLHDTPLPDGSARAGHYYQKIYYYESAEGKISAVNVENINYESALRKSAEVADAMSKALGREIGDETAKDILRHFRNSDRGLSFKVEESFSEYVPGLKPEEMEKLLPAFFHKLIDIDPDVLDDEAAFDIDMREAARVSADWLDMLGDGEAKTAQ